MKTSKFDSKRLLRVEHGQPSEAIKAKKMERWEKIWSMSLVYLQEYKGVHGFAQLFCICAISTRNISSVGVSFERTDRYY